MRQTKPIKRGGTARLPGTRTCKRSQKLRQCEQMRLCLRSLLVVWPDLRALQRTPELLWCPRLRAQDARKETRAGANELWGVWERRFKEHSRLASIAAAQVRVGKQACMCGIVRICICS